MSMLLANDKARLVQNGLECGDPRVNEILKDPEGELGKLYKKAEEYSKNRTKRSYIEASLICETNLERISKVIEIPVDLLAVYEEFFFHVFEWDRLTKIEHIEKITARDKNEMLLKMWALSHGLDFIAWRLGKRVNISPVEGLMDLFSTCIYKSKEAMFNGPTSDAAKESTKWAKLSTDIARLLKLWVMDSDIAKKDLEIAIKEVVPEFSGLDTILEGDISPSFDGIEDDDGTY